MGIYICSELCDVIIRFVEIVFLRSKKREGAGGGNHRKVTAANGGRGQTF